MSEKAYKIMAFTGTANIAVGIVALAVGITTGIISIICGAQLIKGKRGLTF